MKWSRGYASGRLSRGRRISIIAALFKQAILSQYQQKIHGEPPAVLHGHGFDGKGYEIARYLALPDVGYPWSRGRIHGLALWVPPGRDLTVSQMARDAAFAIRRLTGPGVDVSVVPRDDEKRPFAAHPDRWLRPSKRWATAFPAIHERRHTLDLAEVARWVPSRGAARAGRLSVSPHAACHRGGRSRARGSEPAEQASPALFPHRTLVRPSDSGTGRDRLRPTARIRTLYTGR